MANDVLGVADGKGEKNTLLSETVRAAWADLTRTRPRDRTAEDLTPKQRAAMAKAWSVEGDGIYHYNAYDEPQGGPDNNALSPGYWFNKDPNHQVEKLFGRGTASWTSDGDLVFNDTYDLDFGGKNLPGIPTNADPDEVKIRSRISARALGLDPKKLWETANTRIQDRWAKLEPTMDRVYKDVQAGSYRGQADSAIREAQALQARYNRINSGPYKPAAASSLATWKHPYDRTLEEFGEYMDSLPSARISTRQDAKGGDAPGPETEVSEPPVSEPATQDRGGPRIVINPTTFKNKKDALCVAFNEGFRLWMEANDFQPQSEPTDRQRRFFSDTAYADDELQLRRTILARVATFDTSVKDPTDDQLTETAQFLDGVLESGWCKNEWEQDSVSRLSQAVKAAIGAEPVEPREEPLEPAQAEPLEPVGGEEVQALQAGGSTDDDDEKDKLALQNSGQSDRVDQVEEANLAEREAEQVESAGMQPEAQEQAQEPAGDQGAATAREPAADAPQAGKTASPDDEPTEEQARQADEQNKKNLVAATAEYEKLVGQDKPGSAKPMAEAEQPSRPKLTLRSPVEAGAPGSISFNGVRSRRPGQDDGVGGGIENPIVGSDSPGSISFNGIRRRRPVRGEDEDDGDEFGGGIENPVVSPDSPGSISGPVLSYAPGSIESPVDDPRRREERRKRRDRRRRGLL